MRVSIDPDKAPGLRPMFKRHYDTPPGWVRQLNTRDDAKYAAAVSEGMAAPGAKASEVLRRAERLGLKDPKLAPGACLNPPPLKRVEILRAPEIGDVHRFSDGLIRQATREGWASMKGDRLTLHTTDADGAPSPVEFRIVRSPGFYCVHCGAEQDSGPAALEHVKEEHPGPHETFERRSGLAPHDPKQRLAQNPSGYEKIESYECVREA